MTNVRTVRFYDLCRICATNSDEKVNVFSSEGKMKNLWCKISECLSLTIEEKDHLPKVLCLECVQNVEMFMEFRNICNNSQIKLNNWLNAAIGGVTTMRYVNQNTNNSNNESNTISNTLCYDQQQGQGQERPITAQISNYLNANVHGSVMQPVTSNANQLQSNNDFLNSLMQNTETPVIKSKNLQDSNNGNDLPQGQQCVLQAQTLNNNHNINGNKTTHFNTLEEFLKMKPNLKVTPVRQKQQQNQKIKSQLEHDQLQQQHQQQPDQMQLQQLQQQLQQQLRLQLLTSQFQPQQITITAPNTSVLTSADGQNRPISTSSLIQNGANISLDNTNIMCTMGTSTAIPSGTETMNGIETVNEICPLKNKRPKLNWVLTPPQNGAHGVTTNLTQLPTDQNITIPPQIQLQLQPTLQPAQVAVAQQEPHCNVSTGTLYPNLAPCLQAPTQNQSVNVGLQNLALTSTQINSTNIFASPSKCYLPITIKDDATDQRYIAHIDAKNFILPTTYQIQMKLQPQLATADGQPIMQLAPTSIPATLQLTPQSLPTTQTFQTITNMAPFNQNNNINNNNATNNILNGQLFQTTLSQMPQQQQQHQIDVHIQTSQPSNEQISQNNAQDAITQSEIINECNKNQQQQTQQQVNSPKKAQITSQQIISTGNNGKSVKDLTVAALDKNQLPPSATTATLIKSPILAHKKYTKNQTDNNIVEIIPRNSATSSVATSNVTASNLKPQMIKQFCQKQKQQAQQQQRQQQQSQQQQSQQQRLQKANINPVVIQQHGSITLHRIPTCKKASSTTNAHIVQQQIDSQKLQRCPSANLLKLANEQKQQQNHSEQLPHQSQHGNSDIIKLPVLNKQNVTIRCVTKKSNKSLQEQQEQQKQQQQLYTLISEKAAPFTAVAAATGAAATTTTTTTTTTETTITSSIADANLSQRISNQQHYQQQQNPQQIKTKRLLTLPTQGTVALVNTQTTTTTSSTVRTTLANPSQLNISKSQKPQHLLLDSSACTENIPYDNNHSHNYNKSNEGEGSIKNAGKMASATRKILLKKTTKANVNVAAQSSIENSDNNNNTNNNNNTSNIMNNVERNLEKYLKLPVGTTTTIPPGKYIIKDLHTAKALIAAATGANSTTANKSHNNQQVRQPKSTNITIRKANVETKPSTTTVVAATALPISLASNTTVTQTSIKSRNNNANTIIANTMAAASTTLAATTTTLTTTRTTSAAAAAATTTTTTTTTTRKTKTTPTRFSLECSTCSKLFKKREHLTQHVKLHAGIRPFKCSEKDCNKAFSRKEHLHRHLISHTGKKLFSCDICQKPFSRKDNLSKHRRTHTDSGNPVKFICEICNKCFTVKAYYQQHKKQHQSNEVNEKDVNIGKKMLQKNLKATTETINATATTTAAATKISHDSGGTVNANAKLNQTTEQQLLQQLKEIHTQIQLVPQQTQLQQHIITTQPTTHKMHLQFPNSLINSQDLNVSNAITITQANSHNASIFKSKNNNNSNNYNVTLKALTNNSIHHNYDAAV